MSVESIVSVNSLRNAGFQVRVHHYRRYRKYEDGRIKTDLLPNSVADVKYSLPTGGRTEVIVVDKDWNEYVGVSRCCEYDAFNKKIGVQLALTQAIRNLLISKTSPQVKEV